MSNGIGTMQSVIPGDELPKSPTGIEGMDEITGGGLPRGRPTLVCGRSGCGKTLFGMQFLVNGATMYGEPGVFVSFEERVPDLAENVRSLGYDLPALQAEGKIVLDQIKIERHANEETGEYDLEGLFIRLGLEIDSIGAKRVVLDTVEALFAGLENEGILRAELVRLFAWLKDRGITSVITGESGNNELTRHGLEEYVSDCVIFLDHRVDRQISTRRLRVIKYRGTVHGTNEYPFLIDQDGLSVLPITSMGLEHEALKERVSTGVERMDAMLGGQGYYRGSSVLVSGSAGTGKTSLASAFADACCRRGEKCLFFAFEESESQIVRNMQSIGIDLAPHIAAGTLKIHPVRPTMYGLEMHLAVMMKMIRQFGPDAVIIDPISNLQAVSNLVDTRSMVTRMIDSLKAGHITAVLTELDLPPDKMKSSATQISSLIDTWIMLVDMEGHGERNRGLYVLKSRGMAHSNQIREFRLSDEGISLNDVYLGEGRLLTGTARYMQETRDREELAREAESRRIQRMQLESQMHILNAKIDSLRAEADAKAYEISQLATLDKERGELATSVKKEVSALRKADPSGGKK